MVGGSAVALAASVASQALASAGTTSLFGPMALAGLGGVGTVGVAGAAMMMDGMEAMCPPTMCQVYNRMFLTRFW